MALIRFRIDLAIPEDVYNNIPTAKKKAFRDSVRALKALSVRINEGKGNEEMTVKATMHRCTHNQPIPEDCSLSEQEI